MSSHPHPVCQAEKFTCLLTSATRSISVMSVSAPVSRHVNTGFHSNDTQLNEPPPPWLAIWKSILSNLASLCGIFWYDVMSPHHTLSSSNDLLCTWLVCAGLIIIIFLSAAAPDSNFSSVKVYFCDCLRSAAAISSVIFLSRPWKMRRLSVRSGFCASLLKCSPSV